MMPQNTARCYLQRPSQFFHQYYLSVNFNLFSIIYFITKIIIVNFIYFILFIIAIVSIVTAVIITFSSSFLTTYIVKLIIVLGGVITVIEIVVWSVWNDYTRFTLGFLRSRQARLRSPWTKRMDVIQHGRTGLPWMPVQFFKISKKLPWQSRCR